MMSTVWNNICFICSLRYQAIGYLIILVSVQACSSCSGLDEDSYDQGYKAGYEAGIRAIKSGKNAAPPTASSANLAPPPEIHRETSAESYDPSIPRKAILILNYIRQHNHAPDGYEGGRYFGNFEHHLPEYNAMGNKIKYQEWAIQPSVQGQSSSVRRIVTGSDGRAWYTPDQYSTFIEMK